MLEEIYISDEDIERDENNKIIGINLIYNNIVYRITRAGNKGLYVVKTLKLEV